jgi:hypothetical protein
MPLIVPGLLLSVADLETYLRRSLSAKDEGSAIDAVTFAIATVVDAIGFDPAATTDYAVAGSDIDLARGVAVRIAAQHFTNPEQRQSYSGPESLSYTGSPQVVGRIMTEADRRTLVGIANRYAPGFA